MKMRLLSRQLFIAAVFCLANGIAASPSLITPHPSREACRVLDFIKGIEGRRLVSGQHNYPGYGTRSSERIREMTGKLPALWGNDFGFTADDKDGISHRKAVLAEAKRQWQSGALVVLTWHAVRPTDDEPCGWKTSVQAKMTDEQWRELITPGTPLHHRWCAQVDKVAEMLKELRDAGVPVLWRPYHEMNGGWFWWGGRKGPDGFVSLWRMMRERYTKVHGLNNLIWVWNPNAPVGKVGAYVDYFPGLDEVDILATDVYDHQKTGQPFLQKDYEDLLRLSKDKPIALGEVGPAPSPSVIESQPRWTWFMIWCNFETKQPDAVRLIYADPKVLTLDEMPGWR